MKPRLFQAAGHRRGNVLILTAIMMVMLMGLIALAVDIGYLQIVRVELQRSADAAAMAGAWELAKQESSTTPDMTLEIYNSRTKATEFAAANPILSMPPVVESNPANASDGDVVVGYLSNPSDPSCVLDTLQPSLTNAVQVRVRRTLTSPNGNVPLFFARVLGHSDHDLQAQATAALLRNFRGFQSPSDGSNLGILPFALDKETWDDLLAGGGNDQWRWDPEQKQVVPGSDGIREVNLYPQGTGSPGNRGTIDIGGSNNSTADIARQIVDGISPSDLQALGGELKLNDQGKLYLNGDTGISAGVKDELASIVGKLRIVPVFEEVHSPGNNATYTIVEFAGFRVMEVKLTGKMSNKRVILQPARIFIHGAIPSSGPQKTWYVYSPAWLVR